MLVFDKCHVVSKEPRALKIFIPATCMHSLQLNNVLFLRITIYIFILQNVPKNEYFTLKIETD